MGLLGKHKGKAQKLNFYLHVHTLGPWPASAGSVRLIVSYSRGSSRSGNSQAAVPITVPGSASVVYSWEESLCVPATLYQDAAARRGGQGAASAFEPKPISLRLVEVDTRGRQAAAVGAASFDLADFASAGEGQVQQAFPVAGVSGAGPAVPKLLITISCRDASYGGPAPQVERSDPSTVALEAVDVPLSMSTDDEGSRPSSRVDSRPASQGQAPLASTAAALASQLSNGSELAQSGSQHLQPAAAALAAQASSASFDADGFLRDESSQREGLLPASSAADGAGLGAALHAAVPSQSADSLAASGSVKRNLVSAMEQAQVSEQESRAGSSAHPAEVQSFARAAGGPVAPGSTAAAAAAEPSIPAALPSPADERLVAAAPAAADEREPDTPGEALAGDVLSPQPWSTGQSSLSAAGDPYAPVSLQPSGQRRFARDEATGTAGGRRWAWRRDGTGAVGRSSQFQRARLASAGGKPGGSTAATAGGGGSVELEASAASITSEAVSATSASSRRATSEAAASSAAQQSQPGSRPATRTSSRAESEPNSSAPTSAATAQLPPSVFAAAAAGDALGPVFEDARSGERLYRASAESGPAASVSSLLHALSTPADRLPSVATAAAAHGVAAVEGLLRELRNAAALESAVYLADSRATFAAPTSSGDSWRQHTPARRLARTIVCLGTQEGLAFGLRALHAIEGVCGAASGDMHRLAFWWSNVMQLRWMLWALCQGQAVEQQPLLAAGSGSAAADSSLGATSGQRADGDTLRWMQVLLPQVQELESLLFGEMLRHLWWRVLLPEVTGAPSSRQAWGRSLSSLPRDSSVSPQRPARPSSGGQGQLPQRNGSGEGLEVGNSEFSAQGTSRSFETPEEEAAERWVEGLQAAVRALGDPARPAPAPRPHLLLLRKQLLSALLRRVDALMFRRLLVGDGETPLQPRRTSSSGRDAFARGADAETILGDSGTAALDPSLLPFQRGPLTFGTGVALKMAVSRLTMWAADAGVREEHMPQAARSTDMSDYRLFPRLRATADLLMMPKQVLADTEIRREVVPGLPLRRICQLLERFESDDSAPDPLPPGLLETLAGESPGSWAPPSPTAARRGGAALEDDGEQQEYAPAAEAVLLDEGFIQPVSLAQGDESEEELESLASLGGSGSGDALGGDLLHNRFALLRALWASTE